MDIERTVTVCVMGVGLVGLLLNALSFLVLRTYRIQHSTQFYLQVLAVCDSFAILFDAYIDGPQRLWGWRLFTDRLYICRTDMMLDYVSTYVTYWIIVVISLDRVCALCRPITYKLYLKRRQSAAGISLAVVLLCYISFGPVIFVVFGVRADEASGRVKCAPRRELERLLQLTVSTAAITPVLLVLAANSVIFLKLRSHWARRQDQSANERRHGQGPRESPRRQAEIVRVITLVSSVFLLLVGPAQLLVILRQHFPPSSVFYTLSDTVDELLIVLNSSVNFFLYCLSSRDFRIHLSCFLRRAPPPVPTATALADQTSNMRAREKPDQPVEPAQGPPPPPPNSEIVPLDGTDC